MIVKSDKLKVSASAIKTYTQCPRKYYFTYIEKLPKKKWPHTELGSFVHDVLEAFHNILKDSVVEKDQWAILLKDICKRKLSTRALTKEQRASAKAMLDTYLNKIRTEGLPKVLFNEKEFSIELPGNILLRGYIDRIDDCDDSLHIVDYKSGKSKYLDIFQLLVYAVAVWHDNPSVKSIKGSYIVLGEGSKTIPYNISRTDAERCVAEITKVAEQIRTDQTWEPRPTRLCSYCDFEAACPITKANAANDWGSTLGAKS